MPSFARASATRMRAGPGTFADAPPSAIFTSFQELGATRTRHSTGSSGSTPVTVPAVTLNASGAGFEPDCTSSANAVRPSCSAGTLPNATATVWASSSGGVCSSGVSAVCGGGSSRACASVTSMR